MACPMDPPSSTSTTSSTVPTWNPGTKNTGTTITDTPTTTTTTTTTTTGTPTTTTGTPTTTTGTGHTEFFASCEPQANNVLRYDCDVSGRAAWNYSITVNSSAHDPITFSTEEEDEEHVLTVWGLVEETDYTWEVTVDEYGFAPITGTWRTGSLPVDLDFSWDQEGEASFDFVGMSWGCDRETWMVVIDMEGRVRWYEDASILDGAGGSGRAIRAFRATEEQSWLLTVQGEWVGEVGFDGQLRWSATSDPYVHAFHHDIDAQGDYGYAVWAEVQVLGGTNYVIDGIDVYDRSTGALVDSVWLADLLNPLETGLGHGASFYWASLFGSDNEDYTHINAFHVGDDGHMYSSLYSHDAIFAMNGGPMTPEFGTHRWTLTGMDDSPLAPGDLDFSSSSGHPVGFSHEHHVEMHEDGAMTLFDNQSQSLSRAIRIDIDDDAGTADLVDVWQMPRTCSAQGSAFWLDNGNMVTMCSGALTMYEFTEPGDDYSWSMTGSCATGSPAEGFIYRGEPIDLLP